MDYMQYIPSFKQAIFIVIFLGIVAMLGVQVYYNSLPEEPPEIVVAIEEDKDCSGKPIFVDYPYEGGYLDPAECLVQCEEQVQRFIYYTNGQATQCEESLGCWDAGEDAGITCIPPSNIEELLQAANVEAEANTENGEAANVGDETAPAAQG